MVRESTETRSPWARREWRMAMANEPILYEAVPCLMFHSPFHILAHFWLVICKLILVRTTFACLAGLTCPLVISPRPLQILVYLEQCASYRGSRQILSRRQHAPNKRCALNNGVRLITRFYGKQQVMKSSVHMINNKKCAWKKSIMVKWYNTKTNVRQKWL